VEGNKKESKVVH